ncbi:MAG: TylF/MycF/NovP-related O-methyltransferase, partial [Patescibacteria group bacterium]
KKPIAEKQRPYWERYIAMWAASHAKHLEGDYVECGVATGMTAMSVVDYIDFKNMPDRKFYLFDTFRGLDKRFSTNQEYARYKDKYSDSYEFIRDSFRQFPNVIIVRGAIPETLSKVDIKSISYLHIDMNCVMPEIGAVNYFWPKLETAAMVILDDYGWLKHKDQKRAMDEFALENKVKILTLPTGQGLMIKA